MERAVRLAGYASATEASTGTGLAKMTREFAGFFPTTLTNDPELAAVFAEGQRLTVEQATDILWLFSSFDAFDVLYTRRGLPLEEVIAVLRTMCERALYR